MALALHGVIALALYRLRAATIRLPSAQPAIELLWTPPPTPSAHAPPLTTAPAPARTKLATRHVSRAQVAAPSIAAPAVAAAPNLAKEPAAAAAPATGAADVFPRALLQSLADERARTLTKAQPAPRDNPGGWLSDDAAEARTRAGQVAPVWRDVERELTLNFKPPVATVHDAGTPGLDRVGSYFKQMIATVARGEDGVRQPREPGSHALEQGPGGSIDLAQQNFAGTPEGSNLRAGPLAQQQAIMAASGQPARWLRVEIEADTDAEGNVTSARVVMPSGRRAFDRFALAAVRERLAHAAAPSSQSRWILEAGYAVSRPDAIGLSFDLAMLYDAQARKQLSVQYPLKERVETKVSLKWVKAIPQ